MLRFLFLYFFSFFYLSDVCASEESGKFVYCSGIVTAHSVPFDSKRYIELEREGRAASNGRTAEEVAAGMKAAREAVGGTPYPYPPQVELCEGGTLLGYANVIKHETGLFEMALRMPTFTGDLRPLFQVCVSLFIWIWR